MFTGSIIDHRATLVLEMYGLILQSMADNIRSALGEQKWKEIREKAGLRYDNFCTHKVYSETAVPRICQAAQELVGVSRDELMESFGHSFVSFVGNYGYDRILRVLGRHLRDFLNGLDNLHEYLKFSYPKLKAPSFFCENEHQRGLTLHYRSRRQGYVRYVEGQIKQVGNDIYKQEVKVTVARKDSSKGMVHVVLILEFDNRGYRRSDEASMIRIENTLPVRSTVFFEVFPFHIVFDRMLLVRSAGSGLISLHGKGLIGQSVDEVYTVVRPLVDFCWEQVQITFPPNTPLCLISRHQLYLARVKLTLPEIPPWLLSFFSIYIYYIL